MSPGRKRHGELHRGDDSVVPVGLLVWFKCQQMSVRHPDQDRLLGGITNLHQHQPAIDHIRIFLREGMECLFGLIPTPAIHQLFDLVQTFGIARFERFGSSLR